jgi:hypothetical protein
MTALIKIHSEFQNSEWVFLCQGYPGVSWWLKEENGRSQTDDFLLDGLMKNSSFLTMTPQTPQMIGDK